MKVSILTPTANRSKYFALAVYCVKYQSWVKEGHQVEWVIVEDGEEDIRSHLVDLPQNVEVKYIRLDGKAKIGKKRNVLLKEATGDILVFHDDDDIYPSTHISYCVECLTSQSVYGVLGSSATLVYNPSQDRFFIFGKVGKNCTPCGHIALHRKAMEQYNLKFRDTDKIGEERFFLQEFCVPLFFKDFRNSVIAIQHGENTHCIDFSRGSPAPDLWENDEIRDIVHSLFKV